MARHGSSLIPDFAEVYHLRLTEVVETWSPAEAVALVMGLATTNSRYAARLQGYNEGKGWTDRDYLALDHRNSTEGLRAMLAGIGKKGGGDTFRRWKSYSGARAAQRQRQASKIAGYRRLADRTNR